MARPKANARTAIVRAPQKKPQLRCRPHLLALTPYPPGRPIEDVQREFGLKSVIKLASNENPLGVSPKALAAIRKHARDAYLYPDGNAYYLREALSRHLNVAPERLLFGNGSDEIVVWLVLTFLAPEESIVVSEHSFIRYQMGAQLVGARWTAVPLKNWRHDLPAMAAAIDARTRMVFLANPENPVGTMVARREFERFMKIVPPEVMVGLDQAYYEYVSDPDYFDGIDYLERYPNLVVLRTFSKIYGLAGLRVGYAIAHPDLVTDVERVRPPFNVNRLGQEAAMAALEDTEFVRQSIDLNKAGRDYLYGEFERLALEHVPSHTNFVLVRVAREGLTGAQVTHELMRRGVIVRPMGGYGLPDWIRVTVGRVRENVTFVNMLEEVLGGSKENQK